MEVFTAYWQLTNLLPLPYKGLDYFVSKSSLNLVLTKFFVKNVNVIVLSSILQRDFQRVDVQKDLLSFKRDR